jgi:hydroxyethylthiazole kinase-like uncharacterized protein yjeF
MQKITTATSHPLFSVTATRALEQHAQTQLAPHTLMQRAGLAVARLALALRPHAQCIWVACGPGNNGGDGFEAAMHLHQWGKHVVVTWTGLPSSRAALPPDAQASQARALAAGVTMADKPPLEFDFCIDALLGIGASIDKIDDKAQDKRPINTLIAQWLGIMQASGKPTLAVDIPTGLNADTGQSTLMPSAASATQLIAGHARRTGVTATFPPYFQRFTLSLLTLKPGLFTASGRDSAGQVWFDDLGFGNVGAAAGPTATLLGKDQISYGPKSAAPQSSHKGSFGDVAVLGGESTPHSHMAGAALLAARAALHAGAGRVFVALLGDESLGAALSVDPQQPELMFRSPEALNFKNQIIVCGCGGGEAIKSVLAKVLSSASRAVLDADALNAIANDSLLQTLLIARSGRGYKTILTPHPLEAARLAGTTAAAVQADRLTAACHLAERFQCVVVLKGSGTVIATPGELPAINASGNALLATAGTGDVLAGMVGAYLAAGLSAFEAACGAVFVHGDLADVWLWQRPGQVLTASSLANRF